MSVSGRVLAVYSEYLRAETNGSERILGRYRFIGGVGLGNQVMHRDFKYTGALREYVRWGGNPIGRVRTTLAMFGSASAMCAAQRKLSDD